MRVFYKPSLITLRSERYTSDIYFRKEGLFIHKLRNQDEKERAISEILLQEYLPRNIRPVWHTLKLYVKTQDGIIKEINLSHLEKRDS